eukprot:TRINITY_DN11618_c0_g1_i1.p1 TRINITY_DN11618_c0_g1~~TRINITY_DN11618_c0_g1_i1.p1  ORF type:complete len:478 (+),score=66.24 TRINITY_DN11618_c0_g1_i1:37-1434(+)
MNNQGKPRLRRVLPCVLFLVLLVSGLGWYYRNPSESHQVVPEESAVEPHWTQPDVVESNSPSVPPKENPVTQTTQDESQPPSKMPSYPQNIPELPVLYFPYGGNTTLLDPIDVITHEPPQALEASDIQLSCPSVTVPKRSKLGQTGMPTIAYSVVVHHRPDLLRVWFHLTHDPENFYMIHVDGKAPDDVFDEVVAIAAQYENVAINPERYITTYYGWSVLWNHLSNYMRIKQLGEDRDYYINVSGMELPIQTRREIRFFLGEHEPASFVSEYCVISEIRNYWVAWTWVEVKAGLVVVNKEARALPAGVTLHYGSQYHILHHNIVDWMLDDLKMTHLSYWLRSTKSPEDIFFVTAARSSPYKNSVYIYNNMKYVENNHCCTGFQPKKSTPCSLGVCDMEKIHESVSLFLSRVDSADDPDVIPYVLELLTKREKEEEKTGKVKRIPMVPGQILEPEFAPLPSSEPLF